MNLKNYKMDFLYKHEKDDEYVIKLKKSKDLANNEKISIVSDTMFKTMFFNTKRIKYPSYFLSKFIDASFEELEKNLKLSKNELDKSNSNKKGSRADFVAKINDITFNVEVNNCSDEETMKRNILYAYRLVDEKNNSGNIDKPNKIIQFNLNNFAFKDNNKIFDIFALRNDENIVLDDNPTIVLIYLPNLRKKMYNNDISNLTEEEKLLLVCIESNIDLCKRISKGDEILKEYINEAEQASRKDDLLTAYDQELKTKEWGHQEGYKEGYKEGIEEAKINMVKNMIKENISNEVISKVTGVSEEKIKEIIKK